MGASSSVRAAFSPTVGEAHCCGPVATRDNRFAAHKPHNRLRSGLRRNRSVTHANTDTYASQDFFAREQWCRCVATFLVIRPTLAAQSRSVSRFDERTEIIISYIAPTEEAQAGQRIGVGRLLQ
jgi:hypothetical protein